MMIKISFHNHTNHNNDNIIDNIPAFSCNNIPLNHSNNNSIIIFIIIVIFVNNSKHEIFFSYKTFIIISIKYANFVNRIYAVFIFDS